MRNLFFGGIYCNRFLMIILWISEIGANCTGTQYLPFQKMEVWNLEKFPISKIPLVELGKYYVDAS